MYIFTFIYTYFTLGEKQFIEIPKVKKKTHELLQSERAFYDAV